MQRDASDRSADMEMGWFTRFSKDDGPYAQFVLESLTAAQGAMQGTKPPSCPEHLAC